MRQTYPSIRRRFRDRDGLTLTETLLALAIGSVLVAGVMTSYVFTLKGFRGLSNYNENQAYGRRGLDWFSLDMRMGMGVASCTSNRIVAILPSAVDASGNVTASNLIAHVHQDAAWYRINEATGQSRLLATNVVLMSFGLYDDDGNVTTQANRAVSVRVDALLQKSVLSKTQASDFLSATWRMRNKE